MSFRSASQAMNELFPPGPIFINPGPESRCRLPPADFAQYHRQYGQERFVEFTRPASMYYTGGPVITPPWRGFMFQPMPPVPSPVFTMRQVPQPRPKPTIPARKKMSVSKVSVAASKKENGAQSSFIERMQQQIRTLQEQQETPEVKVVQVPLRQQGVQQPNSRSVLKSKAVAVRAFVAPKSPRKEIIPPETATTSNAVTITVVPAKKASPVLKESAVWSEEDEILLNNLMPEDFKSVVSKSDDGFSSMMFDEEELFKELE